VHQDPEYVAVHEKAETATPTNLQQSYMVCELPQKLNLLFSFLRTHTTSKMIVFVSSCKQVLAHSTASAGRFPARSGPNGP